MNVEAAFSASFFPSAIFGKKVLRRREQIGNRFKKIEKEVGRLETEAKGRGKEQLNQLFKCITRY